MGIRKEDGRKAKVTFPEALFNPLYCFSRLQRKLTWSLFLSKYEMWQVGKYENGGNGNESRASEKFFFRREVNKRSTI